MNIFKHFVKFVIFNKEGKVEWWSWPFDTEDLFGSSEEEPAYFQLPDYTEATGAREKWWEKLQQWGNEPGYGAIPQDWQDIWDLASKRVNEYYSGTATTTGAMDKIKASAARRGVSDSPALQMSLARASAEQGGQLSDLAKNQAISQAEYSEKGRQNWLSSLQSLASLKPSFMSNSQYGQDDSNVLLNSIFKLGGAALGGAFGGSSGAVVGATTGDWLSDLLDSAGRSMPKTTQSSILA